MCVRGRGAAALVDGWRADYWCLIGGAGSLVPVKQDAEFPR